jgi:hypothetical protein
MRSNTTVTWAVIALIVGGLLGYFWAPKPAPGTSGEAAEMGLPANDKQIALYTGMRKLWADHMFWTREYLVAAVAAGQNADAAAARLMRNQEDIGNAVAGYYGADAGRQVTTLLKQHISIAVDIVTAAKANDQVKLADANKRWQDNGNQIADFLASANPNWPKATLRDMLQKHLATTAEELKALQNKDYAGAVAKFDTALDHMMMFADTVSAGIVKQFPDKF